MKKVLITGASGFLGWSLCRKAMKRWEVIGLCHTHPVKIPGIQVLKTDLTRFQDVKKMFHEVRPDAVFYAAAASQPNYCELHPEESRAVNVRAPSQWAGLSSDLSIPFVFISTDLVFDGMTPPYSETSHVNPVNRYGEHKAEAEEKIRLNYPESMICRLPLLYGYSGNAGQNFGVEMVRSLIQDKKLSLFYDEIRTPVDSESAAEGILLSFDHKETLIHLGGHQSVSRYDMGVALQQILKVSPSLLDPISQKQMPMNALRPLDVSLESSKAFALGYKPLSIREGFRRMIDRMDYHL
ncbi:MAG: NAD(P)-dependent oxidoreductase [Desulfobacterium sp.]|nr:NAD(P)-dependent oxidoreductase [Desulfobacterium sp.]